MGNNNAILISAISAVSAILVAYIAAGKYRNANKPRDKSRIDFAFDAYERIIKQLQEENDRLRDERKKD